MPRLNAKLKFFPIRHFSKAKHTPPADYKVNEGAVQKFESLIDCGGTQTPVLATELCDYVVPSWLRGQDLLKPLQSNPRYELAVEADLIKSPQFKFE